MRITQTWQLQFGLQSIACDSPHKWFRSLTEVLQAQETSCAEALKGAKKIDEFEDELKGVNSKAVEVLRILWRGLQDPKLEPSFAGGRLILRKTKPNSFEQ